MEKGTQLHSTELMFIASKLKIIGTKSTILNILIERKQAVKPITEILHIHMIQYPFYKWCIYGIPSNRGKEATVIYQDRGVSILGWNEHTIQQ